MIDFAATLQNAPRQRIRLTANAKEIEAMQSGKVGIVFSIIIPNAT